MESIEDILIRSIQRNREGRESAQRQASRLSAVMLRGTVDEYDRAVSRILGLEESNDPVHGEDGKAEVVDGDNSGTGT